MNCCYGCWAERTEDGRHRENMVKISKDSKTLTRLETPTLAEARILEKYDLQEYIVNSFPTFCDEVHQALMLIGKEVKPSADVADRIDLLALDTNGSMVIIELKRGRDKHQLLQAIGYAGMVAKWSADDVINQAGEMKIDKDRIEDHVEGEASGELNHNQRMLLVAEEFEYEVLAGAEWLYERDVEIDCVRVTLATDGAAEYLTFTQIFPVPQLAEQARKRRAQGQASTLKYESWEAAFASVKNKAVIEFFNRHLESGVPDRLRYRELDFGPGGRMKVHVRDKYASVVQWCGRFQGDEKFWTDHIHLPDGISVWTKAHKDDCLRFRLTTAEDFLAFEKAVKELDAKGVQWNNRPADSVEAASS